MKRTMISLLSILPLSFAACGGTDSGDCTPGAGANKAQYVINMLTVPQQRQDYAVDLNGDGRVDNQLGNIIGALEGQMLHVQDGVNAATASGTLVILMSETSADATYQSDSCAAAQLQLGATTNPPTMPDFTGAGHYAVDTTQAGGTFAGPIKVGKFSSAPSATTAHPVTLNIALPLVSGGKAVTLVVQGAHLQFTRDAAGHITGGQLNGAIKNEDVQGKIIPSVADTLNMKIKNDKAGNMGMPTATDNSILSIFDNGGKADAACSAMTCKNPAVGTNPGACAVKGDGIVDTCEVSTAGLIQNVLAPDVQMFDAAGNYAPNKDNTTKDSLSLGLAFTAVPATF